MNVNRKKTSEKIQRHQINALRTFKKHYKMQRQTKIYFFDEKNFYDS